MKKPTYQLKPRRRPAKYFVTHTTLNKLTKTQFSSLLKARRFGLSILPTFVSLTNYNEVLLPL